MKWKSRNCKPRRVITKIDTVREYDKESTMALQMSPGVFATLWRRPYQRPQPRTMPLWAALPVLIWLWYQGELR